MRLSFRFAIALAAVILLVLGANALFGVRRDLAMFEDDMVRDAATMGRVLGPLVAETWAREGEDRARSFVSAANERETVQVRLVYPGGDETTKPLIDAQELSSLQTPGNLVRRTRIVDDGVEVEALATYVALPAPAGPGALLEIAEPLRGEQAYTRRALLSAATTTILLALLCAGATTVLGVIFVGQPVRRLVDLTRRIGGGDFSSRLDLRQRDEIGELAGALDSMSGKLEKAHNDLAKESAEKLAAVETLRHSERLATVGKLASGVAHELGTPLQLVSSHARLVVEEPTVSSEVKESAEIIREQADRMTAIVRQLLDFARRRPSSREAVDLADAAQRAARMFVGPADRTSIGVRVTKPAETVEVEADPEQLLQVLSNLVTNAVQAMPKGGQLEIEVGGGSRPGVPGDWARLSVRDEGVGMPPEVRRHAFEPFFTTKDVGKGTGLGLSVALGIVEEHGGSIDIRSEDGRGSELVVWLPKVRPA
ncbi:MAG: HAMP domain-containing histidine kinase [Polyangiaceae bacterium]|nr:HAMP domain-containing histidine kinase [Polyangiaceae bacterium]